MSTITTAKICKSIRNVNILKESLDAMNISYVENNQGIVAGKINFSKSGAYYTAVFTTMRYSLEVGKFNNLINKIEKKYDQIYELKIQELKRKQEALKREIELSNEINKLKLEEEKKIVDKEVKKIEKIKRMEEQKLKQKVSDTISTIENRAKASNFEVKIIQKKNKKIIQLVRRV